VAYTARAFAADFSRARRLDRGSYLYLLMHFVLDLLLLQFPEAPGRVGGET
jgi:hypothetical protein